MSKTSTIYLSGSNIRSILIDAAALIFIYFIPTLSHLLSLPVYYIEPMRLMLILALVHTTKQNAYILALTMPLFSFLISAHPVFAKVLLITIELSLNVFLFHILLTKFKNTLFPVLLSIIGSKLVYYILKFGFIHFAVLKSGLISTPILIQSIMILIFSGYLFLFYKK